MRPAPSANPGMPASPVSSDHLVRRHGRIIEAALGARLRESHDLDVWREPSFRVLLNSYGIQKGLDVGLAEARIISYYGVRPLPSPWSLVAEELDDHFQFSVRAAIERVNRYFRESLDGVLAAAE